LRYAHVTLSLEDGYLALLGALTPADGVPSGAQAGFPAFPDAYPLSVSTFPDG